MKKTTTIARVIALAVAFLLSFIWMFFCFVVAVLGEARDMTTTTDSALRSENLIRTIFLLLIPVTIVVDVFICLRIVKIIRQYFAKRNKI